MEIRPLTNQDIEAWANLLSISFERPEEQMRQMLVWLTSGYKIVAYGAWDGDQLIAQYASLLASLNIPQTQNKQLAGMSLNMCVRPGYRGQGLVKQVAQPVYQTLQDMNAIAGVGFSNKQGVQVDKHSKSYGYHIVGQMQARAIWLKHHNKPTLKVSDELPETIYDSVINQRTGIHFAWDTATIQHRFANHPYKQYKYALQYDNGCLTGFAIFRPIKFSGIKGISLLAIYAKNMLDFLSHFGSNIKFVHVLTSPATQLERLDWILRLPINRTPYFLTVKPLAKQASSILMDFAAWDCIGGDIL